MYSTYILYVVYIAAEDRAKGGAVWKLKHMFSTQRVND